MRDFKEIRVAVAGTGYVGLSIASVTVMAMVMERSIQVGKVNKLSTKPN